MKYNIINLSQMCDQCHKFTFDSKKCETREEGSGKLVPITVRTSGNIYVLSEIGNEKCFLGKEYESWLWHRIMGVGTRENLGFNASKLHQKIPNYQSFWQHL
jgi:hypothetical protein